MISAAAARASAMLRARFSARIPAAEVSPDGLRRPHWLLRPFRPALDAYRLPPES